MRIMALSGIGILGAKRGKLIPKPVKKLRLLRLKRRLRQLNPQSFAAHMVRNEIARVDGTAETMSGGNIRQYADMLQNKAKQYAGKPGVRWLIQKELALININRFRGKIAFPKIGEIEGIGRRKGKGRLKLKKIFKGIKKISLAANRNAFLALVRLNLRGLALKLKRVNQTKMLRLWERLGGNKKSLLKAISKGSKKRPLLGASKKTRRIKGFEEDSIGVIFNEPISNVASQAIGTGAESTAAVLAAATPIIVAITKFLKKEGVDTAEGQTDIDTGETVKPGTKSALENIAEVATNVAQAAGITPSLPSGDYQVADTEVGTPPTAGKPTTDEEIEDAATKTTATPNMALIAAAGIGLFLLTKK